MRKLINIALLVVGLVGLYALSEQASNHISLAGQSLDNITARAQ